MSDSMERDKDEVLTPKQREEKEKMKQELQDMKMYETWYCYSDMKQILGFINESKDMANMANDEKNAQKELIQSSTDRLSEMIPKTSLAQELEIQEHNDASQSIHSYRANHTSPVHEKISTHGCSSPDPASIIAESRNSAYRVKNLDSEDMFIRLQDNLNMRDSYSHSMSKYISLKSENSLQDSDTINSTEVKTDTQSECEQKLDRWKINPLNSCVSENDVPLKEPNRPIVQDRMPFRLCKDAQTPEMLEKLLPALNFYLKQTAELWHSWHRTTDTKFQWGSPIQVGHAKDNSDKKPLSLSNIKSDQNQMECTNKYSNERPNKRKSTLILSSPDVRYSSSDEDEQISKKKKTQFHDDTSKQLQLNKATRAVKYSEKNQNLNRDNLRTHFDSTENEIHKLEAKEESIERLSSELVSLCSKKILSPNVRKNIKRKEQIINISPKSPLTHSNNEKQSATNSQFENNVNILTDEEILIELENDNEDIKTTKSKNIEIKPLPIKGLSHRIKNECKILEKIQLEKRKKLEIEKEEAQKKETEEKKNREESYRKQLEERQKEEKEKEKREKYKEEKSKRWNTVVDQKSLKRISKEDKEKSQDLNKQNENRINIIKDNRTFEDDCTFVSEEMDITESDLTNNVMCPICNKLFPSDKIEAHAAGCEQYMSENELENELHLFESKVSPGNSNNAEILECNVCSKYKTTNGIHYEEHVNSCLQKQHETESLYEHSSNEMNSILSSPVRCYQPISEQTDSYIDYRRQFPSNSKAHSRKRKR